MLIDKSIIQDGDILYENAFLKIKMINQNYPFLLMQKNGVVTVPYDDYGNVYMLIKHRPNVGVFYELPRGFVENSEDYKSGAVRELIEETGVTPLTATLLGQIQPDTGVMNNNVRMFALKVNSANISENHVHFDEIDKDTNKVIRLSKVQIDSLITQGKIIDGYTLGALSSFYAHIGNKVETNVAIKDEALICIIAENFSTLKTNINKVVEGKSNTMLLACAYIVSVISECARNLSEEYKTNYSDIDWYRLSVWDKETRDDILGIRLDEAKIHKVLKDELNDMLISLEPLMCKAIKKI